MKLLLAFAFAALPVFGQSSIPMIPGYVPRPNSTVSHATATGVVESPVKFAVLYPFDAVNSQYQASSNGSWLGAAVQAWTNSGKTTIQKGGKVIATVDEHGKLTITDGVKPEEVIMFLLELLGGRRF